MGWASSYFVPNRRVDGLSTKTKKKFRWTFSFQSSCAKQLFLISKIKFEPFSSALLFFTYFRFPGFPTFSTSCKLDVFQNCYGTRGGDVPPLLHKTRVIVSSYFSFLKTNKNFFGTFCFILKNFFLFQGFLFQERVGFWNDVGVRDFVLLPGY